MQSLTELDSDHRLYKCTSLNLFMPGKWCSCMICLLCESLQLVLHSQILSCHADFSVSLLCCWSMPHEESIQGTKPEKPSDSHAFSWKSKMGFISPSNLYHFSKAVGLFLPLSEAQTFPKTCALFETISTLILSSCLFFLQLLVKRSIHVWYRLEFNCHGLLIFTIM